MKRGDIIDWAKLTQKQAADGDALLHWRLVRWATMNVARGCIIAESRDVPFGAWTWRALYHPPVSRDEHKRRMARTRRWEREAIINAGGGPLGRGPTPASEWLR